MTHEPIQTLYLIGAIDRYNLGDLLFPALLQRLWAGKTDCRMLAYGLRDSDYSADGGLPTRALRTLRSPPKGGAAAALMVGGEILTARWYLMLRYLLPRGLWIPARILEHLLPQRWLDRMSRRLLGGGSEAPFVLAPDDFPFPAVTAFNAVGGSTLAHFSDVERRRMADKLRQAIYLSVRDRPTQLALQALGLKPLLTPDIGILVADAYPLATLNQRPALLTLQRRFPQGYLCFQAARYLLDGQYELVAERLRKTAQACGLGILLLPIGRAAEHEDQVGLNCLRRRLPEAVLLEHSNIEEVLAAIGHARLFAGTSLHGNIAAMAYGVPHIGLTTKVAKLQAYLQTWSNPPFNRCHEYEQLPQAAVEAMQAPTESLGEASQQQRQAARHHLDSLAKQLRI